MIFGSKYQVLRHEHNIKLFNNYTLLLAEQKCISLFSTEQNKGKFYIFIFIFSQNTHLILETILGIFTKFMISVAFLQDA